MTAPTPFPLRRPLLLTGGPAAGCTSVARALAGRRGLCAVVEVADLHGMLRSGAVQPWRPGAGEGQHRLAAVQACLLAASFTAAGVEAVVCDVVRGEVGAVYRASTAAPFLVALRVPVEVARARTASETLSDVEFDALHAEVAALRDVDLEVDATGSLDDVVAAVDAAWAQAGTAAPTR
ncbi:hypothetical protein SAMN03159343_4051 [Klenkia marina]|uniref:Shikimate kinase n=1 Tax=Klenkia marina TaxID=1960309 RepID=A0A1G4Z316_9ACTN|nr:hypothetical protein [Klenkia marina]SCX60083.1 hypothetical protein SAMN03159343_4051 [Klenkia marina]